ncbi:MAG: hypothetical protein IT353_23860 [Gemmatimonadaceae bacterium]|nr:hypothetical protein [Gemmatimonadaceae bacterium]
MQRSFLRVISVVATMTALTACSESSPTGVADDAAALARGSSGGGATASGTATRSRVEITLTRPANAVFATAKGKAKFSSKTGERELQIEAENIPAGTAVVFTVGGVAVGTGTANALREVRLNLNSTLGQTVPMSVAGQAVTVTTAAGGMIVAGSF